MEEKRLALRRLVTAAILSALVVVLQLFASAIPISGVSLSFVLVPIVIGGAILGVGYGTFLGLVFGAVVAIAAPQTDMLTRMMFGFNPYMTVALCLYKAIAAGLLAALAYKLARKILNDTVATIIAAAVCPIVNTGLFFATVLTVFSGTINQFAGENSMAVTALIGIIVTCNFIPELILNVVLCPVIKKALTKSRLKLTK